MFGPEDPAMWLTRQCGYWENQILGGSNGLEDCDHCSCNHVTQIETDNMDVELFEKAVMGYVYNEPNLRCDVKLDDNGVKWWVPAVDFSEVFEFLDYSKRAPRGYEAAWDVAEQRVNKVCQFGSGKSLLRCNLVKLADCYLVMNQYNHAAADGTTGMRIIGGILEQYDSLVQGKGLIVNPKAPLSCYEDMVDPATEEDQPVMEDMLKRWVDRAENYRPIVPLDLAEVARNSTPPLKINRTLTREGTKDGFAALLARCRKEGITVGSFAFAAVFMAEAVVYIRSQGGKFPSGGIPRLHLDLPVNLRNRVNPPIGEAVMFCIGELKLHTYITEDMTVWGLAKEMKAMLANQMSQKEHTLFVHCKEIFETCEKYTAVSQSVKPENVCDVLVSNKSAYMFPTEFSWGTLSTMHSLGSHWTPGFSNFLFLFQTVDKKISYDMVYNDGPNNRITANDLLEIMVGLMEGAGALAETKVMDLV